MSQYTYIGKSVLRVDARDKATGEAVYSSDYKIPGTLAGKCKRSPHPLARIINIDISKAERLPGVRAVITARNAGQFPFGEFISDQSPLCDRYAHYVGDEVAAVAAIDEDIAEEALDLIEVDYELMAPVFDPEKATEPGAPAVHPELDYVTQNVVMNFDLERGEGEAAFNYADLILEERFTTRPQHQGYLQPRDCVAAWSGGRLTLWAVMQSPYRMRPAIARSLGVSESQVRIIPGYVGGGFGNNASRIWPIAALLARKAGRPVTIVLSREEDFISGRPFPSAIIDIKMGFKQDGTIVAKKMELMVNAGAYVGSCRGITIVASSRADNMYRMRHIKTSARLVYTNTTPCGALRGYGTQLMTFPMESTIDMAAEKLGIDAAEIRLKNATQKGDIGVHGFIFNSCGLSDCIRMAVEKSGWKEKRQKSGNYYGIGLANAMHSAGALVMDVAECCGSGAIVRVDEHGQVLVISGESDIGQGSTTVFTQIAAEEMGVNIEDVRVLPPDTDTGLFALGTFGDRVTVLGGHAVLKAAREAKKNVLRYAAEILKTSTDKLELKASKFYLKGNVEPLATLPEIARMAVIVKRSGVPVIGQGDYRTPDSVIKVNKENNYYGNYSAGYAFTAQVAEVLVDAETGKVEVLNIWIAQDVGKAINPKSCEAQIEGAAMMGMGYALSEDYIFSDGKMLNPNFIDYVVPQSGNTPKLHISLIETIEPATPYGAKGVGEASMNPVASAIANAVCNAIGVRIRDLPITPEKILAALREKNRGESKR